MRTLITAIGLSCILICHSEADLIRSTGNFPTSDSNVTVDVERLGGSLISIIASYSDEKSTGGFSELKVSPGKWIAYFEAPGRLWIFDGESTLHLCERTLNGFKGSASVKVPELWEEVPLILKSQI